jgi:carboxyl-terminal processing protease
MSIRSIKRFRLVFFLLGMISLSIIVQGTSSFAHANEETYKALKLFTDVLEELEKNYVDDVDARELIENAIKGMVGNLDPHSSFMPPEAFGELQDETKGEFSRHWHCNYHERRYFNRGVTD